MTAFTPYRVKSKYKTSAPRPERLSDCLRGAAGTRERLTL